MARQFHSTVRFSNAKMKYCVNNKNGKLIVRKYSKYLDMIQLNVQLLLPPTRDWSHLSFHKLIARDSSRLTKLSKSWLLKLVTENCNRMNSKAAPLPYQILECSVSHLDHQINWIENHYKRSECASYSHEFLSILFVFRRYTLFCCHQSATIVHFGRRWNTTKNRARQRLRKGIQAKRLYFSNIKLWSSHSRWCCGRTLVTMVPEILRKSTLDAFINAKTVNISIFKWFNNKFAHYQRENN